MAILSNNLVSGSWSTEALPVTEHYYGCGCVECAAAFTTLRKNVVVLDPGDAQPVQSADAAALPATTSALLYPADWRWNADYAHGTAITVSYSFMSSNPGQYGGFRGFSESEKAAARAALDDWADVCNVTFKEVSSGGQIGFGNANVGGASGMTLWQGTSGRDSGMKTTHADIYMSSTQSLTYADGSFGYRALLHEIGHAMGLKHTFDTSGNTLSGVENTAQYSVMSYDNPPATPNSQPMTPQLYDIAAVQYLYGANKSTNAGDTVYQWSNTKAQVMTLWDGGGFDTMDASNQSVNCTLDLREGKFSNIGIYNGALARNTVAVAVGTVVEKAVGGSGVDIIIGNASANVLVGGAGADQLTGGAGADAFCYAATAQGGDTITDFVSGTDRFEFNASSFGISSGILDSSKFAKVSGTYGGNSNASFVFDSGGNLWFDSNGSASGGATRMATLSSGSVAASDIHLVGDFTAPGGDPTPTPDPDPTPTTLNGTAGNDTLSGIGGDITMIGGLGNDTYMVDSPGDSVVEYGNAGIDTVKSSLSYTLGTYAENLTLTGGNAINGTGSAWHNLVIGNSGANVLKGMAGNDTLRGWDGNDQLIGGSGQDVITGGLGIDTFMYLSTGDVGFKSTNGTKGTLKGDTLTDFIANKDKLWFDDAGFALADGNAVNGVNFSKIGTAYDGTNASAADYSAGKGSLIFDSTGTLYYDANGKGAGYHVVATIQSGGTINASDIIIA
jgi:serralysin